ncbi:MAG: glycoside hydrolase family 2 [Clostridia bacterium]|nr:glycoside hydrolase family 2 [Clostridia bacterium]
MEKLKTRFVPGNRPLNQHPTPQFCRSSYLNLNGTWDYGSAPLGKAIAYDRKILVPFSPESDLSGVGEILTPEMHASYRLVFDLPEGFNRGRYILHFGAVDEVAEVLLNGTTLCTHEGGNLPFQVEVTEPIRAKGNELIVNVQDSIGKTGLGYGKQKLDRGGIWYTPHSGIWQTVWLETVPEEFIRSVQITPHLENNTVTLRVNAPRDVEVTLLRGTFAFAYGKTANGSLTLNVPSPRLWTPEDPFLYDIQLKMGADEVKSYFAMRSFGQTVYGGKHVFALNGKPYFLCGLLDQGYYPDGLFTPPSDEAMINDIEVTKKMGFNMLRKHIKVEPDRWYYHCDRLGVIVIQDMVNGGDNLPMRNLVLPFVGIHLNDTKNYKKAGREDAGNRRRAENEMIQTVEWLYNHPSIAVYTVFNEGWGQFDSARITKSLAAIDSTRLYDSTSGWHDQGAGQFQSRHIYFKSLMNAKADGARILSLSECGGFGYAVEGHTTGSTFGYTVCPTTDKLLEKLTKLFAEANALIAKEGLSVLVYTQLTDVEDEVNGLMTYDRQEKLPASTLRALTGMLKFK